MSIKEVADAYIEIHGDLNPFRRDLAKAAARFKKEGAAAGQEYVDALTARADSEFGRKWNKMLDAIYSGDQMDWNRLFGEFDSESFDKAGEQIEKFVEQVRDAGLINENTFDKLTDGIRTNTAAFQDAADFQETFKREVEEARLESERFARSLDGLRDAANFDDMERSLKGIADATKGLDFGPTMDANYSKMVKAAGGFEEFATQIDRTLASARELGRVTEEQSDAIVRSVDRYIDAEKQREMTLLATRDAAKQTAAQMTALEKSFEGREMRAGLAAITRDLDRVAEATRTQNWSAFAQGHKTIDGMRDRLKDLLTHFRGTAEMSEESARRIEASFSRMANNPKKFGVELDQTARKFRPIHFAMDKLHTSWVRMDSTVRVVLGLIASAAGPMATLGSGLAGSLTAIVSSMANAAGAIVPLAAGMTAFGVAIGLAATGWDAMVARVPEMRTALDGISSAWTEQATSFTTAWQGALTTLLQAFGTQLGAVDFGTPLGQAFAGISDTFTNIVNGPLAVFLQALAGPLATAVQGLGTGIANMSGVLLSMLSAAAPTAAALGNDFARWSEGLLNALSSADGMRQMSDTFARMRESLLVVLDLAGSLGMALGTMFSLGADSGDRLLTSLTGVVDKFTAWMNTEGGRQAMIDWFTNAETIIRSLEPVIVAVATALGNLVTPESIAQFSALMVSVGTFVTTLGELLAVVSQLGILNVLFAALNAIGAAITPLLPAMGQLATIIGATLVGAITNLTPLFAAIGAAIAPFIAGLAQIWQVVGPAVVDAFGRITTALTPVFAVLGQLVAFIMGILAPALGPFIVGVINSFVGLIEGIANVVMGVVNIVRGIFTGDWPMIWNGIVQVVRGVVQAVWELINLWIVGKLVGGVRMAITAVSGVFRTGWQGIMSFFRSIITGISSAGTAGMNALRSGITAAINGIRSFFTGAWNGIRSFFTGAVNGIRAVATSVFAAIRANITSAITSIRTVFTAGWTAIRVVATTVMNAIRSVIQAGFNAARSIVQSVISTIRSVIQSGFSGAQAAVSSAINAIRNFITSGFNAGRAAVSSAMAAIRSAVSSGIAGAVSFFSSMGSRIAGAVGNLAGVGRNIIQGLIDGIRGMAGAAIEAATSAVSGAISAAKNLLGIKSPSRVFMEFGQLTGEGFVIGLSGEAEAVKSSAERLIDAVKAPFDPSSIRSVGQRAAVSLAEGFDSRRALVESALQVSSGAGGNARGGTTVEEIRSGGGTTVILEAGAVQTTTNVADPELVAESTIDRLVVATTMLS